MKFTHLHVHSHYSLLDGLGKIDELLDKVKELGMDSIALTDHGTLYGTIEFFLKAKEKGIKPIVGCEMYLAPGGRLSKTPTALDRTRYHLVLWAKNLQGYKNLMKLVSIAHLEGFYYKPRIDKEVLKKYSDGLIGGSACIEGEIPSLVLQSKPEKALRAAKEYEEIFGKGNFFLELQHHPDLPGQDKANKGIIEISKEASIPVIATGDAHYINPEDNEPQDILLCVQTNSKVYEKNRMSMRKTDLSLRSPEQMAKDFAHVSEAVSNTQKIVEACNLEIPMGETQLPHFEVPAGHTAESYLMELCEEGLTRRYGEAITNEHRERLNYELEIIHKTGLSSYFLIVQDFVNWAKGNGIVVGPGRGSAAGSFVSYLLNITNIDPIKYNLLFERFLNPERITMPDIDIDFADDRRDEVLEYVRHKYGNDHVAQIITFGTMAARAAIRDAGRALGYPYEYCDKTAKMIPMFSGIDNALKNVREFKDFYNSDPQAKKLIDSAARLEGVARHASMHACGVVITKDPVENYTPLQYIAGSDGGVVTQYSASTKSSFVEKIGLLKMDFLGLKNLTIIQNTLRIVEKLHGKKINIDEIPLGDKEAFALLQRAGTTGVFQLESGGMKRYLKQLKPTTLEDVIAMVALYRPGPMDWIPDFVAAKHGQKKVKYLHPKLEPILKNTYGVAVYQEQVMQIAQELAGFTLGEADVLRKAMGKKIPELIRQQRDKFVEGAVQKGIDRNLAEKVFNFIEPFAGYGFNRSHAACYALIGYQTAYLKAHYPAEFMAALLTSDQHNTDRVAVEIAECRELGISILPPDTNESFGDFTVVPSGNSKKSIRFGLDAIKNVGHTVVETIMKERKRSGKFSSLADFFQRVRSKDLNKKSIEALAKSGALDAAEERNKIIGNMETVLNFIKAYHRRSQSNQSSLFSDEIAMPRLLLAEALPASKNERLTWEKELLGLYVSDHPVSEFEDYLAELVLPIKNISAAMLDSKIRVGGAISKIQKFHLKRSGEQMYFVTLEDKTGVIEALVFPKILKDSMTAWNEGRVVIVEGRASTKEGTYKLIVDSVKPVNPQEVEHFRRISATRRANGETRLQKMTILLPPEASQETLKGISGILDAQSRGKCKVYVRFHNAPATIETPYRITFSEGVRNAIENVAEGAQIKVA